MTEVEVANDIDTGVATSDSTVIVLLDSDTEVIQTFEQGPPGPQGAPGIQGPPGSNGEDGNTVHYGPSNPLDEGVDGDFYINTTTHFIFGPKTAGAWPAGTSLVGPQGVPGTPGAAGPQGPQGPQGVPGAGTPATATPLIDGVGAVGTSTKYAKEDHVHPSDVAASAVRFDAPQVLTTPQALQARQNIYAAPGDAMSYNGIQINGSCEVSQRLLATQATLPNGTPRYIVDGVRGHYNHAAGTAVILGQQSLTAPQGFPNFVQVTAAPGSPLSAPAAADFARISVLVEGYRCARLGWNVAGAYAPLTACFMFYANVAGTFTVNLRSAGSADRSYNKDIAYPTPNTWQFVKLTIPPPTGGTWLITNVASLDFAIAVCCGSTYQGPNNAWANGNYLGTAGTTNFFAAAGNFIAMTGLTLLPGNDGPNDWPPLAYVQRPFAEELIRCQRYFQKSYNEDTLPGAVSSGSAGPAAHLPEATTNYANLYVPLKPKMRAQPTITLYSPMSGTAGKILNADASADLAAGVSPVGQSGFNAYVNNVAVTQSAGLQFHWTAEAGL